jgi:hypothetical protein
MRIDVLQTAGEFIIQSINETDDAAANPHDAAFRLRSSFN